MAGVRPPKVLCLPAEDCGERIAQEIDLASVNGIQCSLPIHLLSAARARIRAYDINVVIPKGFMDS